MFSKRFRILDMVLPRFKGDWWIALLSFLCIAFSVAICYGQRYQATIRGESGKWTMVSRNPWIGGSYTQINDLLKKATGPELIKILKALKKSATGNDAVLVAVEADDEFASLLYVSYTPSPIPLDVYTPELFRKSGPQILKAQLPKGSSCKFSYSRNILTAGYPAVRAYFDCKLSNGIELKSIFEIVSRPNDMLDFLLFVDSRVKVQRFSDYRDMLQSLRFTK